MHPKHKVFLAFYSGLLVQILPNLGSFKGINISYQIYLIKYTLLDSNELELIIGMTSLAIQ